MTEAETTAPTVLSSDSKAIAEEVSMYIYIVGFCPASNDDGSQTTGIGGYDWYLNAKGARERMRKHLEQDIEFDSDYVVRRLRVPPGIDIRDPESVDAWLNDHPNLFNTHEQL